MQGFSLRDARVWINEPHCVSKVAGTDTHHAALWTVEQRRQELSAVDIPRRKTAHPRRRERPPEGGDLETCLGGGSKNTGLYLGYKESS